MRILVIGGGIAGVSIAAELAANHEVTLLEMEHQLAHHTTGRSAATYIGTYGNSTVQALTAASFDLFMEMSEEIGHPLLVPRDSVTVFANGDEGAVDSVLAANPVMSRIGIDELLESAPYIDPTKVAAVVHDPSGYDIDVAGLHQGYVRRLVARNGTVVKDAEVLSITFDGHVTVRTDSSEWQADLVVNAAGAWGDVVAQRAGCTPVGLSPKLRTIFTARVDDSFPPGPIVVMHPEEFYFMVARGSILGSPADETPSEPCDARPEETDVALAIESVNSVTTLGIRSIESSWAGLRTFAPDRSPVVGCRDGEPGFFWLCGQGGYGIQMAPGLATFAARMVDGASTEEDRTLMDKVSPDRF